MSFAPWRSILGARIIDPVGCRHRDDSGVAYFALSEQAAAEGEERGFDRPNELTLAKQDLRSLASRMFWFAVVLLGAIVDTAFLSGWIALYKISTRVFDWLGTVDGLNGLVLGIIQFVFEMSTLILVLTYVVVDLVHGTERIIGVSFRRSP
jgi:hypothetical protein